MGIYEKIFFFVIQYFIFAIGLYVLYRFGKKGNKFGIIDIIIIAILVTVAGLRYQVGSDYGNYLFTYSRALELYKDFSTALYINLSTKGLDILMYITTLVSKNIYGIFWSTSIIIYSLLIYKIRKLSNRPAESLLLYCMLGYMLSSVNIIKQAISMTIFLFSIDLFYDKKYIRFAILSIIAYLFHQSYILVFIVLMFTKFIKVNIRTYFIMIVVGIILMANYMLIPKILVYFPSLYDRFILYFDGTYALKNTNVLIGTIMYVALHLFLIPIILKYKDKLIEKSPISELYMKMLLITLPISIMSLMIYPINRFSFYFNQFIIFLIPMLPMCIEDEGKRVKQMRLIYAMLFVFFILFIIFSGSNNYYSYSTYLNF